METSGMKLYVAYLSGPFIHLIEFEVIYGKFIQKIHEIQVMLRGGH
jgi:hypothetical protein